MTAIQSREVRELMRHGDEPSLSMYVSMQPPGGDTKQNYRNFLNSLKCMEEELIARGYEASQISPLLAPAYDLMDDGPFWKDQKSTLAYFLSRSHQRFWKLGENLTPQLYVDSCFHVRPLLPLASNEHYFYLLALSQKRCRFWRGNPEGMEEIDVSGLQGGMSQLRQSDVTHEGLQHHTTQPALRGKESVSYHGHGGIPDTLKADLLAYCRQVDGVINKKMTERLPLFVASVGYLFPIFKKASSYPVLIEHPIEGNPDLASGSDLHAEAWRRLMSSPPLWEDDYKQYCAQTGSGRTSDCLMDIVPAAQRGQIESLFVIEEEHRWGHLENETGRVYFDPEGRSGAADLYETVVRDVMLQGGRVHVMARTQMPTGEPLAALFRYPLPAGQPV